MLSNRKRNAASFEIHLPGVLLAWAPTAYAAPPLPPRSERTASASSTQVDALAPQHAIDGDCITPHKPVACTRKRSRDRRLRREARGVRLAKPFERLEAIW
ncbi:MAG: hypothetical protein ACTIJY_10000 [Luteimonas sp.]